jgi:hypothetical protein
VNIASTIDSSVKADMSRTWGHCKCDMTSINNLSVRARNTRPIEPSTARLTGMNTHANCLSPVAGSVYVQPSFVTDPYGNVFFSVWHAMTFLVLLHVINSVTLALKQLAANQPKYVFFILQRFGSPLKIINHLAHGN